MVERSAHLVERAVGFLRVGAGLVAEAGPAAGAPGSAATTIARPSAPLVSDAVGVGYETMLRAGLSVAGHERSRITEEYRIVADRVLRGLYAAGDDAVRASLILVTSARPGEGKTFTTLNLAAAIVGNGLGEVLLVDVDAKVDSLTDLFGLTGAPGLLDLAAAPARPIDDLLLRTALEGLLFLPIGKTGMATVESGATRPVNAAIERLARRLPRHILVLDCAPCLSSSDPIMLASLVDQIVMVVEAERTQRGVIESALKLIHGCPNVTLLLNKVQLTTSATFGAYHRQYYGAQP